ncbi:Gfo/Idh/MocA family oxidoreductase [uncultured Tateyamaria sp.]|uniref:Gfo/Idh/MocA family protein n=1 Tax=uncultured Tateyamaria sp. TaxID=455651 RepID=UPI002615AF6F|nr:Gfo/Idh/MocA family oxidoreductase [uncultured Tateyamaria sp.]
MRIAFIGTSHVHTPDYLSVCRDLPWVEMVGVARVDVETLNLLTDLPPIFDRQEELPPHDLAVVLTDIQSHDEVCARLSSPAVFIEKPLGLDGDRADGIGQMLSSAGKRVEVGFFLRHSTALKTLVDASKSPEIGNIRFARFAFAHPGLSEGWLRHWPAHIAIERMGGGAFTDLAIHLVDAALAILGPLRATSCVLDKVGPGYGGLNQNFDSQGQATLTSAHGALVHVWASAEAPEVMLTAQLICEHGEISLNGGRVLLRYPPDNVTVLHDGQMPTPADGFRAALEALRNRENPILEIADAVSVSQIMDSILEKSETRSLR